MKPKAILIAGPTASGKSALAVRLARSIGGVVVNTDALQVYEGLHILTARPDEVEMEGVEHRLYGHVSPLQLYSVAEWRRDVDRLLRELRPGVVPVFCGGTGLYFRALLTGLDVMPPVPDAVRERWRGRAVESSAADLHEALRLRDPVAASRIRSSDVQRVVRALELVDASGRRLDELQQGRGTPAFDIADTTAIVLTPDRTALRECIARRFERMLEAGAMEEASAFDARFGTDAPLADKAIGLRELLAAQRGELTLKAAAAGAVTRSRQYAKRQDTWFRNQFGPEWRRYGDPLDVPVG